eukprot:TRINITY_DN104840_c0_g1_i1.p3 TRINITY_DN104840_c0_g1~~TRINITY_DN104840_c0_g1_i1.p3  ORF type:complete len:111 (-),score=0.48 TRINITY_DN104840_c0_g1_i1:142-441(-)
MQKVLNRLRDVQLISHPVWRQLSQEKIIIQARKNTRNNTFYQYDWSLIDPRLLTQIILSAAMKCGGTLRPGIVIQTDMLKQEVLALGKGCNKENYSCQF